MATWFVAEPFGCSNFSKLLKLVEKNFEKVKKQKLSKRNFKFLTGHFFIQTFEIPLKKVFWIAGLLIVDFCLDFALQHTKMFEKCSKMHGKLQNWNFFVFFSFHFLVILRSVWDQPKSPKISTDTYDMELC